MMRSPAEARRTCPRRGIAGSDGGVFARERELGRGIVVELGAGPLRGGMAGLALRLESGRLVRRVGGLVEIRHVARRAVLRGAGKLSAHVALLARHRGVLSGEGEPGRAVIELRALPLHRGVAGDARRGEARGRVIRILRGAEILFVAVDSTPTPWAYSGRRRGRKRTPFACAPP